MRLGLTGVVVASIRLLAERRGVGGTGNRPTGYNLIRPGQGDAVQKLIARFDFTRLVAELVTIPITDVHFDSWYGWHVISWHELSTGKPRC
jgi:hypothetical protein